MVRTGRWLVRALALATCATAVSPPALGQPVAQTPQPGPAPTQESVERLADLIRLWTFVRLFHVDERAMTAEWERALEEAAPAALAAPDDAALAVIAQRMMAHIQPAGSAEPVLAQPASSGAGTTPPFRLVEGTPVASCPAIARATAGGGVGNMDDALLQAIRQRGLIFDCRGFDAGEAGGYQAYSFNQWLSFALPGFIDRPLDRGAMRARFHDGYPPDTGGSSGGYARGVADTSSGRVEPAATARAVPRRIVFIADRATPQPWTLSAGLAASGRGGVVAEGTLGEPGLYPFRAEHLTIAVKVADYLGPDGRPAARPDACASSPEAVMAAARALLAGRRGPACPAPRAAPSARPGAPSATPAAPAATATAPTAGTPSPPLPLGRRMVALAKLWGTVEYFFPYRQLADRPWSDALQEFVPVFAAASNRHAYEDAVVRLARRMDDSHVFVGGLREHRLRSQWVPPVYVRPIEGRFAVAGIGDPALGDRLRVGDEIVAVDGRPVAEIVAELRPLIASSTEQSLAQRLGDYLLGGAQNSEARIGIRRGDSAPVEVVLRRGMRFVRAPAEGPSFRKLAPDIGYINLERLTREEADRAIDELIDTRAIVFDLRGYPQGTAWVLAPRLALDGREGAGGAQFRRPSYRGPTEPHQMWTSFTQPIPTGTKPRYRGRVIVLIDDRAISQSEHTALFFKAAANPIFVGTPTTGANGDVTRVSLPGGLSVGFTGHDVRHADGRQLQRVGIQPDIVVAPTFAGLREGRDEVLEAGLAEARRPAEARPTPAR